MNLKTNLKNNTIIMKKESFPHDHSWIPDLHLSCRSTTDNGFKEPRKKKELIKRITEQRRRKQDLTSSTFSGLSFRSIGPAWASGRISDFAVNPENHSEIYAGVSAGNIWKTTNNGTTWTPVFDKYGAYAIGCLKMDPENPSCNLGRNR